MTFYPHVGRVRIEGPYDAKGATDTPSRRKIFVCRPASAKDEEACARADRDDAGQARLPPAADAQDVGTLMEFYLAGRSDGTLRCRDRDARCGGCWRIRNSSIAGKPSRSTWPAGKSYRLSDLALASRLSFFLWSSIPDDELMTLASQGKLREPAVLEQQVRRMIADPKSAALIDELHRAVAERPLPAGRRPDREPLSGLRRQPAAGASGAKPSCSSTASCTRTAACSIC